MDIPNHMADMGPLERAWQMAKGAQEDVQRKKLELRQLEAKALRAAEEFQALVAQNTSAVNQS